MSIAYTSRKDIETKYKSYKKGSIDKYIDQVSEKNKKKYEWMISSGGTLLKIYTLLSGNEENTSDKSLNKNETIDTYLMTNIENKKIGPIVAECELHKYASDMYYVVFPERKVLCWVNWFI